MMELINYMVFDEKKDFGMDIDYLYDPLSGSTELVSVDYVDGYDMGYGR